MNTPSLFARSAAALIAALPAIPALAGQGSAQARRADAPAGSIYHNVATGERVISRSGVSQHARGFFLWENDAPDPCEFCPEQRVPSVFPGVHDADLGATGDPLAAASWHGWFEHPGDSRIDFLSIAYFTQVEDPELDGVDGLEMLLVFTEGDSLASPEEAVAHTFVWVTELPGAQDENGDGTVSFDEGRTWYFGLDFGETPVEVGDTDGVPPPGGTTSGVPGVDTDGDGLINSGYAISFRQPNVAEGDPLFDRFPNLIDQPFASKVLNPDGYDPLTFENIRPMGAVLGAPSNERDSYLADAPPFAEWPTNPGYTPAFGEGVGSHDGYRLIDALGNETEPRDFGGFSCGAPQGGNPWAGWSIGFNNNFAPDPGACNGADIAFPFDVLDLQDIIAFIENFENGCARVDFNIDGLFDLVDITRFIESFLGGCP